MKKLFIAFTCGQGVLFVDPLDISAIIPISSRFKESKTRLILTNGKKLDVFETVSKVVSYLTTEGDAVT